jgi:hypothetical protein
LLSCYGIQTFQNGAAAILPDVLKDPKQNPSRFPGCWISISKSLFQKFIEGFKHIRRVNGIF